MKAIDGDSHFMEPMDLFERYIDPAFRERTVKMVRDPESGKATMLADGKPLKLRDVDQVMGILVGYGEKEQGLNIGNFDRYLGYSQQWQDMDARVRFLDEEGFDKQVLYPSLGIVWEGEVDDPALADALCRAYNTWAFELVASHKDRLFPAAHISIRDPALAVREMERVAKLGAHTISSPPRPCAATASAIRNSTRYGRRPNRSISRSASTWFRIATTPAAPGTRIPSQA